MLANFFEVKMATTVCPKLHDKTLTKISGAKMEMDMTRMSKCHGHFQNAIADTCITLICPFLESEWPDHDQEIDHAMTLILTHVDDAVVVNVSSLCGTSSPVLVPNALYCCQTHL